MMMGTYQELPIMFRTELFIHYAVCMRVERSPPEVDDGRPLSFEFDPQIFGGWFPMVCTS